MPTKCLSLVKGRRIRLTRLDGCGRPVFGESSVAVSSGFISVALTANTIESDEINVTNANGDRCVYEPSVTSLVGYGVEISFCEVDPDLFAMVTGNATTQDIDGNNNGFDVDTATSLSEGGFALELWAGSVAGDACTTDNSQGSFGYLLLPFMQGGIVGDFTVENGAVTFVLTGANTKDGNAWGVGPHKDIQIDDGGDPGPMLTPVSSTLALRTMITDVIPPAALCGTRPLLNPTAVALTAIGTSVVSRTVTFTSTPADLATPVYYEFGDGTWDYLGSGALGDTSHTYANAGTYPVRATSNGTWVQTTVTVS